MKNLRLKTAFTFGIILMQTFLNHAEPSKQQAKQSIMAYLHTFLQPGNIIPTADKAVNKNIIFDLDGVLCTTNNLQAFYEIGIETTLSFITQEWTTPSQAQLFAALQDVPASTTYDAYYEGVRLPQIMVDWQCGSQKLETIQKSMVEHIKNSQATDVEKKLLIQTVLMMTEPKKFIATRRAMLEGVQLLHELKEKGYHLYVLSNWDPNSFDLMQQQFPEIFMYNQKPMFDGIMTSGQVGILKPDQAIFTQCLEKFNLQADTTIFIDDTTENILAAQMAGLIALHCKNKNIMNIRKQLSSNL